MPNWDSRTQSLYGELGNMYRHYSSCRTAVVTAILPACLAILGVAVSERIPFTVRVYLIIAELVLFAFAMILNLLFSVKTEHSRRLLVRLEAGQEVRGTYEELSKGMLPHRTLGWTDNIDKLILIAGGCLHAAYWAYFVSTI